jgi:hypothetical protein
MDRAKYVAFAAFLAACSHRSPNDTVFLNHVFGVLDEETFAAVRGDRYVRDVFAATRERTTQADGREWTGFYLYGEETYVELFGPHSMKDAEVGSGGIGFGVEAPAAAERLAKKHGLKIEDVTRTTPTGKVPWFKSVSPAGQDDALLSTWVMEYVGKPDITRHAYLADRQQPGRLLRGVRRARFLVPTRDRDEFARAAGMYGWKVSRDGEAVIASGPSSTIEVAADPQARGLVELDLDLAPGAEPHEVRLDHSVLTVGAGGATWKFEPVRSLRQIPR